MRRLAQVQKCDLMTFPLVRYGALVFEGDILGMTLKWWASFHFPSIQAEPGTLKNRQTSQRQASKQSSKQTHEHRNKQKRHRLTALLGPLSRRPSPRQHAAHAGWEARRWIDRVALLELPGIDGWGASAFFLRLRSRFGVG